MTSFYWAMIFFAMVVAIPANCEEEQKCRHGLRPEFENCSLLQEVASDFTQVSNTLDVCKKTFNLTVVNFEPYSSESFREIITNVLTNCCSNSDKIHIHSRFINTTHLNPDLINISHFMYPVLGRLTDTRLHGLYFIPLIDVHDAYYVTKKHTGEKAFSHMIKSCRDMWPLLLIYLMLSLIAGFVIWLLETWSNQDEFPRTFYVGIFEGFWWSFVSATTVGYGDKTPRTVVSRLFSVLWILIGISICSMVTASLSSDLTTFNSPPSPSLQGSNVGVLRYRLYEASLVARHGGVLKESRSQNVVLGIRELTQMLDQNKIKGFVIDSYVFMYVYKIFRNMTKEISSPEEKHDIEYFLKHTIKTKITYDKLSYGMLLKHREDYVFLKEYFTDNQLTLQTCKLLELNALNIEVENPERNLLSADGGLFLPSAICLLSALALIFSFGCVYDIGRNVNNRKKKKEEIKEKKNVISHTTSSTTF